MKRSIGLGLACLFISQGSMADKTDNSDFLDSVQDHFVQQVLGGVWETSCIQDPASGTSLQLTYDLSDRSDTALVSESYADSACASSADLDYFVGELRLDGMYVNASGQYVYRLTLTDEKGVEQVLEVFRQPGSLVLIQSDHSEQQFLALDQE